MSLCRFRDALGRPGEGAHSARFAGLARTDILLTALLALVLNMWLSWGSPVSRWLAAFIFIFLATWALGIVLHAVFCVDTPISRALFPARVKS